MNQILYQHDDLKTYIIRRLLMAIIVFFLVTMIVFLIFNYAISSHLPEDPFPNRFSKETIEQLRNGLGLNHPLIVQYFDWLSHILRGDLGTSLRDYSTN
jgi:peptide/nickel transport system permease protein